VCRGRRGRQAGSYSRAKRRQNRVGRAKPKEAAHRDVDYIINQPETLRKLQEDLRTAIPDPKAHWTGLIEELPYLGACTMVMVHLSYGVSARNPRIFPDKPTTYKSWEIPAGTPVSMTIADMHHDEAIYPNSYYFIPKCWRNSPKMENASSRPLIRRF
jgi:cytochrome P450